jgi:hypothetical protein
LGFLVLDVCVTILAVAGFFTAAHFTVKALRSPRLAAARARMRLGAANAEKLDIELTEKCKYCEKPIDPKNDVHVKGLWWHYGCFKELLQ